MKRLAFLPLLFVFVMLASFLASPAAAFDAGSDRAALVAFYNSTNGANWYRNDDWLDDTVPHCDWYGVTCDADGRVVKLFLEYNELSGTIPPDVGNLSELQILNLDGDCPYWDENYCHNHENHLTGPIPAELGKLSNLEELTVSSNQLTGPIPPELGNLSDLGGLGLESNEFSGPIPPELGDLSNLEELKLSSNQLTGPIPPELGKLSNIVLLYLSGNELTGPIPPQLGNLSKLHRLYLSGNQLAGPIPSELANLSNLEILSLSENQLTCWEEPDVLYWALNQLFSPGHYFYWDHPYPGYLICTMEDSDLAALLTLYISTNGNEWTDNSGWLDDTVPFCSWYGVSCNGDGRVTEVQLSANQLTGSLPQEIGYLSNLARLNLSANQLTG